MMKLEIILTDQEYKDLLEINENENFSSITTLATWVITSFIHDEIVDKEY